MYIVDRCIVVVLCNNLGRIQWDKGCILANDFGIERFQDDLSIAQYLVCKRFYFTV